MLAPPLSEISSPLPLDLSNGPFPALSEMKSRLFPDVLS
jgi:hypothetical protein